VFCGIYPLFFSEGLTAEERELIEQGFRDKVINIICCTSTLAAGIEYYILSYYCYLTSY
jgi:superfamily II DNA helicase RecQ